MKHTIVKSIVEENPNGIFVEIGTHYGVIKAFSEFCKNNNLNGELLESQYKINV
jgi:hypothetical protein